VQVATALYATVEAIDRDAYVAEAIADNLNRHRVSEEVVMAGTWLITRF
jgi:precorrin-6B methylase 2